MTPLERHRWMLDQISEIVGEHCRSWVFAAEADSPDRDDPDASRMVWGFDGGLNTALGLSRRIARNLDRVVEGVDFANALEEDEEDGDFDARGEGAPA